MSLTGRVGSTFNVALLAAGIAVGADQSVDFTTEVAYNDVDFVGVHYRSGISIGATTLTFNNVTPSTTLAVTAIAPGTFKIGYKVYSTFSPRCAYRTGEITITVPTPVVDVWSRYDPITDSDVSGGVQGDFYFGGYKACLDNTAKTLHVAGNTRIACTVDATIFKIVVSNTDAGDVGTYTAGVGGQRRFLYKRPDGQWFGSAFHTGASNLSTLVSGSVMVGLWEIYPYSEIQHKSQIASVMSTPFVGNSGYWDRVTVKTFYNDPDLGTTIKSSSTTTRMLKPGWRSLTSNNESLAGPTNTSVKSLLSGYNGLINILGKTNSATFTGAGVNATAITQTVTTSSVDVESSITFTRTAIGGYRELASVIPNCTGRHTDSLSVSTTTKDLAPMTDSLSSYHRLTLT